MKTTFTTEKEIHFLYKLLNRGIMSTENIINLLNTKNTSFFEYANILVEFRETCFAYLEEKDPMDYRKMCFEFLEEKDQNEQSFKEQFQKIEAEEDTEKWIE